VFKDAYQEALRAAIKKFQDVSYKYLKKNAVEAEKTKVEITEQQVLPFEERASIYIKGENSYWLLKDNEDYILYIDKGETVLATLKQADRGTYAYDSEEIEGAAYFTPDGDLIVEYLAKNKDAVQKLIFKRE
jgi:hypothetical protein